MWVTDIAKAAAVEFIRRSAANRRNAHFVCGDCERRDMCGMPPTEDCELRLLQIEAYGDYPRRCA